MSPEPVRLPAGMRRQMVAHALAEAPLEACGIVAGRGGRGTRFYPTGNAERSRTRYSVPPAELLRITREIERRDEVLYGIFHSHPETEAYPSATDIRLAFYPDSYYLILSLADPDRPVLRAFTIRAGHVAEHPITEFDDQAGPAPVR
ncbi:MAG TPA: M67 family metallopeptidase [Bacillota bacterium]